MDVGRLVNEHSVSMEMCEFVCERRQDRHRLTVVVDGVLLVLLERKPPDAFAQLLVDDAQEEPEVLHVTMCLYSGW